MNQKRQSQAFFLFCFVLFCEEKEEEEEGRTEREEIPFLFIRVAAERVIFVDLENQAASLPLRGKNLPENEVSTEERKAER